jgi:hypothetical protein
MPLLNEISGASSSSLKNQIANPNNINNTKNINMGGVVINS